MSDSPGKGAQAAPRPSLPMPQNAEAPPRPRTLTLALSALGVVYGDTGKVFGPVMVVWFATIALLLFRPELAANPFYGLVPRGLLYPMVALATIATVIASQAMISGVFSLTQQAVQLGYLPRLHIVHTSSETRGQIYLPQINWALMCACV